MATIPKYVYDDLKCKAHSRVNDICREIIKPLQEKVDKQKEQLKDSLRDKISSNLNKNNVRINSDWRSAYLEVEIPKKDYDDYNKKCEQLDNKIQKIRQQVMTDLNKQVDNWLIGIFQKASDNQVLELPELKIDKNKYKL